MKKHKKITPISFGWIREFYISEFLFTDDEIKKGSLKPQIYVSKEKHSILWDHIMICSEADLVIKGIYSVVLRLPGSIIKDDFKIEYYTSDNIDSKKTLKSIEIFNLTTEELIDLVKSKIIEEENL